MGAVDSNCALLLCDAMTPDLPIVYCSEAFEKLTRYRREEIIGQNCRFLQSPDGNPKSKSRSPDTEVPKELRNSILAQKEIQTCVLNYKKDGQPFINLLTTIPIQWDSQEVRFIVGFQVDRKDTCV